MVYKLVSGKYNKIGALNGLQTNSGSTTNKENTTQALIGQLFPDENNVYDNYKH